jgi:hypothetical protein
MKNRSVWFARTARILCGGGGLPRIFGIARKQALEARISRSGVAEVKFASAGRIPQRTRRARYATGFAALFIFAPLVCLGQQVTPSPTPSPGELEAEAIVVTATRFDIPLELSPASASVITSEDFEQKQIERVSDALREIPGLSVVQTGTAGQDCAASTRRCCSMASQSIRVCRGHSTSRI